MKLQNNFKAEIKPHEWLYIVAAVLIISLLINGDKEDAIKTLTGLLKVFK